MKFSMLTNFIFLLLFLVVISCKDYYNDTIEWADNIEAELNLSEVQKLQPDFIEVDWNNPLSTSENERWYLITEIKGNRDVLSMSHFLVFKDGKYKYRESKK
ncbi:hypothetical protein [uncultured Winogradskyella sp.]|uniref:hypothetical protein n=1 Tax=uncultured Winogradskyella sp. TaxID=395353 RepID=UPI00261CF2A7|nr:hypothetical protein [uncultured Winogradskyella sp.]